MSIRELDILLLHAINGLAGQSIFLDLAISKFALLNSFKTLPLIMCIVWLWFRQTSAGKQSRYRNGLACALIGMFVALVFSRLCQNIMPQMPRPIHTPGLDIILPTGSDPNVLHGWSSFPSDHAAVAFAIAFGIARQSRPWGLFALAWAAFVICLPRIYIGYHYPSDIVMGALIGIASVWIVARLIPEPLRALSTLFEKPLGKPAFYAASFAMLFWITTMFNDIRQASSGLYEYVFDEKGETMLAQASATRDPPVGGARPARDTAALGDAPPVGESGPLH